MRRLLLMLGTSRLPDKSSGDDGNGEAGIARMPTDDCRERMDGGNGSCGGGADARNEPIMPAGGGPTRGRNPCNVTVLSADMGTDRLCCLAALKELMSWTHVSPVEIGREKSFR